MTNLRLHAIAALGLGAASVLVHDWLFAAGVLLPLTVELWLTTLPGLAVRLVMPTLGPGMMLVVLVLSLQYFVVLRLAAMLTRAGRTAEKKKPPAGGLVES